MMSKMADKREIISRVWIWCLFIEVETVIERWRGYEVCTHPERPMKQAECPPEDFEGRFLVFKLNASI